MNVAVLRETHQGESRVALVPDTVRKLKAKVAVLVESGAGEGSGHNDADYETAGATVMADRKLILEEAQVLATVNRPALEVLNGLRQGAVVLGFLKPLDEPEALREIAGLGLSAFSMEMIPRITRAQAMDALTSMATVAGYKAAVLGASRLPRLFPMLMTAASTIAPARVLVLGAGVAGLQAIATARRLGAVIEAYDVRAAAGEQVRSLGATFLEVDLGGIKTETAGGYAAELTPEALQRGRDLIAEHAKTSDVIITTALVPGRPAPLLVTAAAVDGMKRGSIIVDLAGASGGNCELSRYGEEVVTPGGVLILAPFNLAATVPAHASQLYSNNVAAFLNLIVKDGALNLDLTDTVVGPACVVYEGRLTREKEG